MKAVIQWCLVACALFSFVALSHADGVGGYFGQQKLYCNSSEELVTEISHHKQASDDGLLTNGCGLLPARTEVIIPSQKAIEIPGNASVLIYRAEIIRGKTAGRVGYIAFPVNAMDKDGN